MIKRTKYIPAIITLIGCLATTIITYVNHYSALKAMIIILVTLIVFYIAGLIIRGLADKYLQVEPPEEEKKEETQENPENEEKKEEETTEEKA